MNKVSTKIIISVLLVAIFMAPISASIKINKNKNLSLNVETKKVEATNLTDYFGKNSYIKINSYTSNSVTFSAGVIINPELTTNTNIDRNGTKTYDAYSNIYGALDEIQQKGVNICYKETNGTGEFNCHSWYKLGVPFRTDVTNNEIINLKTATDMFNFKPNTQYTLRLVVLEGTGINQNFLNFIDFSNDSIVKDVSFTTTAYQAGDEKNTFTDSSSSYSNTGAQVTPSFGCGLNNLGGCILQILYYLWQGTALIAELAGHFLDFFVYYATNNTSYSNTFVEKSWAAVRDIANIFFIIALFYVAIKTILGLNVSNNKKLVGMVIAIGLVINFSLFTAKLVIDGSNILAKVFYNNISSKYDKEKNPDGTAKEAIQKDGQKSISVGLIDKFNPQNIVMESYNSGLGLGYAIFIIILLMGITLYTAYIFFSVALLFVARVVSLWLSMIFSPIAFASYTVPFDIPGFGHKEWWGELIKNAMLAPIFIFLLYIIVLFASFLGEIVKYTDESGTMQRLMAIIIPFFILMILLKKSKEIAVQYSGEMGKAIQGIGGALAGVAVGGAALTTAFAGRTAFGRTSAAASRSDSAEAYKNRETLGRNLNWKEKTWGKFGNYINKTQESVGHVDHARHEMDELKNKVGLKGTSDAFITKTQQEKLQKTFTKEKRSEIESDLRTGRAELIDQTGNNLGKIGEEQYKSLNRTSETNAYLASQGRPMSHASQLTKQDDKNIENNLNKRFNDVLKISLDKEATKKLDELQKHAKENVSVGKRLMSKSTSGSYDIRNFTTKMHENDTKGLAGLSNRALAGLTGAVALGIRSGMKIGKAGLGTSSFGTPQKDILKDLGNTVTEALKGVKIDVKLGDGGGHGGGGHGGGHDSHGGGHGGGHDSHGGGHH